MRYNVTVKSISIIVIIILICFFEEIKLYSRILNMWSLQERVVVFSVLRKTKYTRSRSKVLSTSFSIVIKHKKLLYENMN